MAFQPCFPYLKRIFVNFVRVFFLINIFIKIIFFYFKKKNCSELNLTTMPERMIDIHAGLVYFTHTHTHTHIYRASGSVIML